MWDVPGDTRYYIRVTVLTGHYQIAGTSAVSVVTIRCTKLVRSSIRVRAERRVLVETRRGHETRRVETIHFLFHHCTLPASSTPLHFARRVPQIRRKSQGLLTGACTRRTGLCCPGSGPHRCQWWERTLPVDSSTNSATAQFSAGLSLRRSRA